MVDASRLRASFGQVAQYGDEVPLFFYSYLFLRHPEVRPMFPPSMAAQRDRLVGALGRIVADVDRTDELVPFLQALGRDHRKFEVVAEHYPAVGEALLATLEHFLRDAWTPDLAEQWAAAFGVVAEVMSTAAAAEEAASRPGWWDAEIVAHEVRLPDLAVITVRPSGPLEYLPGQSFSVELASRPRLWRYYSPANAPRPDGTLEFHVRAVDGGWVSSALVHSSGLGDTLRLGPPVGELALDTTSGRDLLMLAGGTGLAPLRAIVEQVAQQSSPPRVRLFTEARTPEEFYDLPALQRMQQQHPWLSVTRVVRSGGARSAGAAVGPVAEVALHEGGWDEHDVYLCGSVSMVEHCLDVLAGAAVPGSRVRYETFGYRDASGATAAGVATEPVGSAGEPIPDDGAARDPGQAPVDVAPSRAFVSRGESA